MKCPNCGRWNQANLPHCVFCGEDFFSQKTPRRQQCFQHCKDEEASAWEKTDAKPGKSL